MNSLRHFTNLPRSHLNITAPTPPPGFNTQVSFDSSIQLRPLEVYICAVELMSVLSNMPWTAAITSSMVVSGSRASTEIALNTFPPPPFADGRLQTRYAVLGLYEVCLAVAQGNRFYEVDAGIYLGEEEMGWLTFRPKTLEGSTSHSLASTLDSVNTTAIMADSGKFADPKEEDFVITFSWDGVRIKAQDIFTTFLDAFAIAAPHNNTDLVAYIPAARSASGDMVLSTWAGGTGPSDEMSWARLKRALILIWLFLITGKHGTAKSRFEGLIFGFEYKGKSIGAGRMLRFDASGESIGGVAVEK